MEAAGSRQAVQCLEAVGSGQTVQRLEAAGSRQEVEWLETADSRREVQWLEAADETQQQKAEAATLKTMASALEEPKVESAGGGQKEVQGGCQLWPMEVLKLEETAAEVSMEPAVTVP